MEFITVEQFKEQPKEVQEVFLKWWKPQTMDLCTWFNNYYNERENMCILNNRVIRDISKDDKGDYIPLLTEGQLRKFIEDKLKSEVWIEYSGSYEIITLCDVNGYENLGTDLLQAYWMVACIVAKEGLDE